MTESKSVALPLGDAPIHGKGTGYSRTPYLLQSLINTVLMHHTLLLNIIGLWVLASFSPFPHGACMNKATNLLDRTFDEGVALTLEVRNYIAYHEQADRRNMTSHVALKWATSTRAFPRASFR